ncbi:methyl-accepting chemotaxis protein [Dyella ginsengisoli]|uniref:methyl-accepting chemotaxis protein n=1 Tax=Dyella ginsengisoli TaxID=363848 RepID=UPI000347AE69|nr:methyl-accepting chemotaxis protein [Dyella ginsengisoli]
MNIYSPAAFETPGPSTGPAESGKGGLSEFFRYHGFWAPGVRLFRAIGFKLKALIIAVTFLVPIAFLAWTHFAGEARQIASSAREHQGVAYGNKVMGLLPLLVRSRVLAVEEADAASRNEVRTSIAEHLTLLADEEKANGDALGTGKAYGVFVTAVEAADKAVGDAPAVVARHTAAIEALLGLLDASTDGSNLTLDPDIDTYYLMDASMTRLPAMIEAIGKLQAEGSGLRASGKMDPERVSALTSGRHELAVYAKALENGLGKAVARTPALAATLDVAQTRKALLQFTSSIDRALHSADPTVATAVPEFIALGDHAIDALVALEAAATGELDALLAARSSRLVRERDITIAVLAASMLAALYLFVAFGRVLGGGMREIAFHVDAMREGDLTTCPRAWGADEPAQLMFTLSEMQQAQRRMVGQMRVASDAILGASSEIASGTGDLSRRTEMSAANLEETAAAMEEIAATVKGNEQAVDEATKLALANARTAEQGGEVIGRVVHTMESISEASGRIGDIVGSIDAIAFQTNILALNAAVEAARAGEHGRGFAVVASEVRALAQSAAASAREIKGLIGTNLEQVDAGVQVVRQAGETIGELVGGAKRISELLGDVASGARELSIGVNQTASAVQQLDGVTQENAALVSEAAASVVELKGQAQRLASEVARFRLTPDTVARRAG